MRFWGHDKTGDIPSALGDLLLLTVLGLSSNGLSGNAAVLN